LGDQDCLLACPFEVPQFGNDQSEPQAENHWKVKHPMQKCHFCIDRLELGKNPACVDACPVRALDAGAEEEIRQKYPTALSAATGFPDSTQKPSGEEQPWGNVRPSFYFKPKLARGDHLKSLK